MAAPSVHRVLELYSGVGGMHYALRESDVPYTVVSAVDINTTANHIYHHNFKDTTLISCGIEKLTVEQMKKWQVDMILMSPPCQPFTRVGKKKDVEDIRAKSFLHVLHLVEILHVKPSYILVENVKGFEQSQARLSLVQTLQTCGYVFQEFLLTPLQFGIPNSRLRYYLVAKRSPLVFSFPLSQEIQTDLPPCATKWLVHKDKAFNSCHDSSSDNVRQMTHVRSRLQDKTLSKENEQSRCSQSPVYSDLMVSPGSRQSGDASQDSGVENSTFHQNTDQSAGGCKHKVILSDAYHSEIPVDSSTQTGNVSSSSKHIPVTSSDSDLKLGGCCNTQQNQLTIQAKTEELSVQNSHCGDCKHISCCNSSQTSLAGPNKTDISDLAKNFSVQNTDSSDCKHIKCVNNCQPSLTSMNKTHDVSASSENISDQNSNCDCIHISSTNNSQPSLSCMNKTHEVSTCSENLSDQNSDCIDGKDVGDVNNDQTGLVGSNKVEEDYENCGENLRLCGEGEYREFTGCRRLEEFMEKMPQEYFKNFMLGDKELKMFIIMDIVRPSLKKSSCFTRRYGHYMDGAGPIIQMSTDVQAINSASVFKSRAIDLQNRHCWGENEFKTIRDLHLRYFTPREIANILCFPHHFALPEDLSTIQLYRCLGNSLNVHVVSVLIRLMTDGDQ